MASPEKFTPPGVVPVRPSLRVIEGGKSDKVEKQVSPEMPNEGVPQIPKPRSHVENPTMDLKQLFREDAQATDQRVDEIRKNIEIPAPSIELTEEDIEDIGGVEYLNAQPGGEEVKGSTYESTSDKIKTLRMKNNPLEGQKGYDEAMDVPDDMEEVNADNLVEVQDELPTLVREKDKLPRFEAVSESEFPTLKQMPEVGTQPKGERLRAEDIISEQELGQLPRFPEDLDKAA